MGKDKKRIKIVSLFSGIGAFEKGLKLANIDYELVNFAEIDKFAIESYCSIHNEEVNKNLGDISEIDADDIKEFDLLVGGSPCQDFSISGNRKGALWTCRECGNKYNPIEVYHKKRDKCPNCQSKNIEKTRSSLIIEYLRVLFDKKPKFFVYENVKNLVGKEFKQTFDLFIDELREYGYNVYYKVLNSKDYGIPQNRERVFVVGIRNDIKQSFVFPEKIDNCCSIKDILLSKVDEKYYLKGDKVQELIKEFLTREKGIYNDDSKNRIKEVGLLNIKGISQIRRVYDVNGISPTLDTCQGGNRQVKVITEERKDEKLRFFKNNICGSLRTINSCGDKRVIEGPIIVASRGRYVPNPTLRKAGLPVKQRLEKNHNNTSNTLTSFQKDNYVFENTIKRNDFILSIKCLPYRIRKLTPREAFRLMGFSDEDYDKVRYYSIQEEVSIKESKRKYKTEQDLKGNIRIIKTSDNQLYKQAGNSIVVNVLMYLFENLF